MKSRKAEKIRKEIRHEEREGKKVNPNDKVQMPN